MTHPNSAPKLDLSPNSQGPIIALPSQGVKPNPFGPWLKKLHFCPICGASGASLYKNWCRPCLKLLRENLAPLSDSSDTGHEAPFIYQGAVAALLVRQKYHPNDATARYLGRLVAAFLKRRAGALGVPQMVIPIPRSPLRMLTLGADGVGLLSRHLAKALGVKLCYALKRSGGRSQLEMKGAKARLENVQGAFTLAAPEALQGLSKVVLLDDVYTTGATLLQAKAVIQARFPQLHCQTASFAATKPHDRPPLALP